MPITDKEMGPVKSVVLQRTRRILYIILKFDVPNQQYTQVIVYNESDMDETKTITTKDPQALVVPDQDITDDQKKTIDAVFASAIDLI
jgi:hypothetical protein